MSHINVFEDFYQHAIGQNDRLKRFTDLGSFIVVKPTQQYAFWDYRLTQLNIKTKSDSIFYSYICVSQLYICKNSKTSYKIFSFIYNCKFYTKRHQFSFCFSSERELIKWSTYSPLLFAMFAQRSLKANWDGSSKHWSCLASGGTSLANF